MLASELTARVQAYHCPNSTDAGGSPANHYIKGGACVICDRTPLALAYLHGVA
jgi:hypothetical protein